MTRMDEKQMEALARLVWMLREADGMSRWDGPGIVAKLREAAPTSTSWDLAHAALTLAENRDLRTPAILPSPGPHWTRHDGTKPARRGDHTMRCPEHGERLPCEPCKTDITPPPEDVRAEMRAAIEEAKTKNAKDANDRRERTERKS